jgi:hypothetical protein
VSYDTPVAAITKNGAALKSSKFHSRTTSGHIARFLLAAVAPAQPVEPEVIAALLGDA